MGKFVQMCNGLDNWGSIRGGGTDVFVFATASKLALGLTQPPL
jgi:hypothetical protein